MAQMTGRAKVRAFLNRYELVFGVGFDIIAIILAWMATAYVPVIVTQLPNHSLSELPVGLKHAIGVTACLGSFALIFALIYTVAIIPRHIERYNRLLGQIVGWGALAWFVFWAIKYIIIPVYY